MLAPEKEPAITKKNARVAPLLLILLTLLFGGWFLVVFTQTYNFSYPVYQEYFKTNSAYLGDIFTKIPRGIELVIALMLFLFCTLGVGNLILKLLRLECRDEIERMLLSIATGLPLFTFVTLAVGAAGFLQRRVLLGLLTVAFAISLWYGWQILTRRRGRTHNLSFKLKGKLGQRSVWQHKLAPTALVVVLGASLVFYLYLALLGSLTPFLGGDAGSYYIGPSKYYADRERIYDFVKETHLGSAFLPYYHQTLYAALIKLGGLGSAKILNWGYALLTVGVIIYFCRIHFNSSLLGLWASLIFISVPEVAWSASLSYIDMPLPFFCLLMLHAFLRWRAQPGQTGWLVLIGMLGGYATGVKFFGAYTLVLLILAVAFERLNSNFQRSKAQIGSQASQGRSQNLKIKPRFSSFVLYFSSFHKIPQPLALIFIGVLAFCLPWFTRSYITTGNPVFPVLNSLFKSPYWNEVSEKVADVFFQKPGIELNRSWVGFLILPWASVTENNKYWAVISPIFLVFLPVCGLVWALTRSTTAVLYRLLAIYLMLWLIIWFAGGTIETRYLITIMPIAAILIAYTVVRQNWPGLSGQVFHYSLGAALLIMISLNNPLLAAFQFKQNSFNVPTGGILYFNWNYLYRGENAAKSFDEMLVQPNSLYNYVSKNLAVTKDKIYDTNDFLAHNYDQLNIEIFNGGGYDGPTNMGQWSLFTPDALINMQREKISHVAIFTASAPVLRLSPAWNYLQQIFSDEQFTLYRVDYPGVVEATKAETLAMPEVSSDNQILFLRGFDGQLYSSQRQSNGNWGSWRLADDKTQSQLANAPKSNSALEGFKQGEDKRIYMRTHQADGQWSGWQDFDHSLQAAPVVGRYGDGTLAVFIWGTDNILYTRKQNREGSWGKWQSLSRAVLANPAVATNRDGSVTVFVRGFDSTLVSRKSQSDGTWLDWWQVQAEGALATPLLIPNSNGNFELIARVFNGKLYNRQQVDGTWGQWQVFGNGVAPDPAIWRNSKGIAEIFVLGQDGGLYSAQQQSNGSWPIWWSALGEGFERAPSLVPRGNGFEIFASRANQLFSRQQLNGVWQNWQAANIEIKGNPAFRRERNDNLRVFVRGTDNKLYSRNKGFDGQWQGNWQALAENLIDDPVTGQNADGSLEVFIRLEGAKLYSRQLLAGGSWRGDWELVGTDVYSSPVTAQNPDSTLQIFVHGQGNEVFSRKKRVDDTWENWQALNFKLQGRPAVGRNKDGTLEVFVRGQDNSLYSRKKQPDGQWQGWELLGQNLLADPVVGQSTAGTIQVIIQTDNKGFYSRQRLPDGSWQNQWFFISNQVS